MPHLLERGHRVLAGARDLDSLRRRLPSEVMTFRLDLDTGNGLERVAPAAAVIHMAPPSRSGRTDLRTARLVASLGCHPLPSCLIYISTTGVYGDQQGAWVDESTPTRPRTERANRRVDAERRLRTWGGRQGTPWVHILRVPGIYGPGRLPVERVQAGQGWRVAWPETRYTNLIHVDDLVQLILRVLERGRPNRIYNAGDGNIHPQGALLGAVANLLGLSLPEPLTPEEANRHLSPTRLSFLEESRRCAITRAFRELGFHPLFPDLAAGVQASWSAVQGQLGV